MEFHHSYSSEYLDLEQLVEDDFEENYEDLFQQSDDFPSHLMENISETKATTTISTDDSFSNITGKNKKRLLKRAPAAPKRFKSAYICYVMDKIEEVKSLLQDSKITDIMKILAQMWKLLSPVERQKYENQAEVDKNRYFEEMSRYSGPMKVPNTRQTKHPGAPKRAMSAFLSFSQNMRPLLRSQFPHLSNSKLSTLLAEKWRTADPEVKIPFIEREVKERNQYHKNMAEWKMNEFNLLNDGVKSNQSIHMTDSISYKCSEINTVPNVNRKCSKKQHVTTNATNQETSKSIQRSIESPVVRSLNQSIATNSNCKVFDMQTSHSNFEVRNTITANNTSHRDNDNRNIRSEDIASYAASQNFYSFARIDSNQISTIPNMNMNIEKSRFISNKWTEHDSSDSISNLSFQGPHHSNESRTIQLNHQQMQYLNTLGSKTKAKVSSSRGITNRTNGITKIHKSHGNHNHESNNHLDSIVSNHELIKLSASQVTESNIRVANIVSSLNDNQIQYFGALGNIQNNRSTIQDIDYHKNSDDENINNNSSEFANTLRILQAVNRSSGFSESGDDHSIVSINSNFSDTSIEQSMN